MQIRLVLAALVTACVVAALPSCSRSPAEAQQHHGDSPPPQPTGKPQVVQPNSSQPVFNSATVPGYFKTPTQQLINTTRDKARREWRKDAVVTNVAYHMSAGGDGRAHAWVYVRVVSASDGAQRSYSIGDIYDGQFLDFPKSEDGKKKATREAIGDIRFGLTEATALLKRLGYDQAFDEVDLDYVGKGGKPEVPAFRFLGMRDAPGMFPLTVNSQSGRIMDWRDAYRTPDWSDKQIAEIFARLRNKQNQPKSEADMVAGAVAYYNCVSTGGTWIYATNACD